MMCGAKVYGGAQREFRQGRGRQLQPLVNPPQDEAVQGSGFGDTRAPVEVENGIPLLSYEPTTGLAAP
jgi:hypothetical protein